MVARSRFRLINVRRLNHHTVEVCVHIESFEIASRFRGPPNSGNGGYVCGRIAKHLSGTIAVRLKSPPPLDTEVRLESTADTARVLHGSALIGEARRAELFFGAEASAHLRAGAGVHTIVRRVHNTPFPGPITDEEFNDFYAQRACSESLRVFVIRSTRLQLLRARARHR